MSFDNPAFFVFFAAVAAVLRALPWSQGRLLLVAASYFFYGTAHPWYCLLLLGSTIVDYAVARRMSGAPDRVRLRLLWLSVATNLSLLGLFKYGDFVVVNLNWLARWVGFSPLPLLDLVLPVGISFYTFQTMSYTVDVYRRRIEPTRDFWAMALYVAYFPQLVAGPIERAAHLMPQLSSKPPARERDFVLGLQRVLWGLVKKAVLADRLGLLVDEVYAGPAEAGASVLILATVGFVCQLYLDFSGYTDIAIGLARIMGVRLSENFAWPLLARSPSEFWARWHITLTSWFRDYVFAPLGGLSRRRPARSAINTVAVMTLIGIWHGASWTFVVFGLLQGALVAGHQVLRLYGSRRRRGPLLGRRWWSAPLGVLLTQAAFALSGVVFRAPTLGVAGQVLAGMASHPWAWESRYTVHLALVVVVVAMHVVRSTLMSHRREVPLPALARALWLASLILLVLYGSVETREGFIYFQF